MRILALEEDHPTYNPTRIAMSTYQQSQLNSQVEDSCNARIPADLNDINHLILKNRALNEQLTQYLIDSGRDEAMIIDLLEEHSLITEENKEWAVDPCTLEVSIIPVTTYTCKGFQCNRDALSLKKELLSNGRLKGPFRRDENVV